MIVPIINVVARGPATKAKIIHTLNIAAHLEPKLKGTVEINIIGSVAMRRLNRTCRGIDAVTDVLSFAWSETAGKKQEAMLGQVYVCPSHIAFQAKNFSVTFVEEFIRMLTHGLLHIVGYDHVGKREAALMFSLQELIVAETLK